MAESALTTGASVFILGLVGYGYTRYYKYMVLEKMEGAFRCSIWPLLRNRAPPLGSLT
jgi:hypothetical protein